MISPTLLLPAIGCENLGAGATTSGDSETGDVIQIEGCAPFDDEPEESHTYVCEGTGTGYAYVEIELLGTQFGCATASGQSNSTNCEANPMNLEDLYAVSGDQLAAPAACCTEAVEPEDLEEACVRDCAFAACRLGAVKLREQAAPLSGNCFTNPAQCNAKGDLNKLADLLDTSLLHACADLVYMESPGLAEVNLGAGGGAVVAGNVNNVTLFMGCSITDAVADDPPAECTNATHSVPTSPLIIGDPAIHAVTIAGPFGDGAVSVLSNTHTIVSPTCSTPPCSFSLRQFDLNLDDVAAHNFSFTNITLSLDSIAEGSRNGTVVTIPPGELVFNLSTEVKVGGESLFGTAPHVFQFNNTAAVQATWDTGIFTVQEAEFALGSAIAVLNTEFATL